MISGELGGSADQPASIHTRVPSGLVLGNGRRGRTGPTEPCSVTGAVNTWRVGGSGE